MPIRHVPPAATHPPGHVSPGSEQAALASLWLTSGGLELPPGQLYMTFNETVDPKFVKESGNLLHR